MGKGFKILIVLMLVSAGLLIYFRNDLPAIGKSFDVNVKFSVIMYNGKIVSAVPITTNQQEVAHFLTTPESELKEIIGVEAFYENRNIIEAYKKPKVATYIAGKGKFTHVIITQEVGVKNAKKEK